MKNEIGRKLTSLTIMAIMFAGLGIAQGFTNSFMPLAQADLSETDGLLSVSSTNIQGAAILEIVVNDPDLSDTTTDLVNAVITFDGTDYDMSQGVNGKWYVYVVDASVAALMDADDNGMEYGVLCTSGLGISGGQSHDQDSSTTDLIVSTSIDIYANAVYAHGANDAGMCLDIDNAPIATDDTSGSTAREDMTDALLRAAPSLSNHNDAVANGTGYCPTCDLGQLGHNLNASGYGSWPYIVSVDFSDEPIVEYGSDAISVTYGNTDDLTSISLTNQNPADHSQIHLTITDPALNLDPTAADSWQFDLSDNDGDTTTVRLATNGSNNVLSAAELGQMKCADNCALWSDSETEFVGSANTLDLVKMVESGANTGVFESFDVNGVAQFSIMKDAAADKVTVFSYGGNSVDLIITYNDASITFDAGGDWKPATPVTVSINDPDANRNPTSAETLSVGNATHKIPTIKMGSPLTLTTGSNPNLQSGDTDVQNNLCTGICIGMVTNQAAGTGEGSINPASGGGAAYAVKVYNTTDSSERLRILHTGSATGGIVAAGHGTATWINVTTGHTRAALVDLPGTVVLNYDVSAPAELLSSTAISVYVWGSGSNFTENTAVANSTLISVQTTGNAKAGSVDLDDGTQHIKSRDITSSVAWDSNVANTNFVTVGFKFTHASTDSLQLNSEYAISADFCNFDQNNGSLTHNCIYRLEAVETGDNTGIFEGTVEYITLNNSTTLGTTSGEHAGGDREVEGLLGYIKGDALSVVLMDSTSGSDSVRVTYNDTDAFQVSTKIGAQLETITHTGTVDLDGGTYGVDDIGVITIVDPDLNQDSGLRDVYQNSSTTFKVTITKSGSTAATQPFSGTMSIIETGADTGVFVGTFKVPNFKGSDLKLTYFESKDASGSAVEYYDDATIQSNTGSVSFDKSVYPVPWSANELSTGDGGTTVSTQTEAGTITAWITVSDSDETNDTLTTGSTTSAGTILVKIGTTTCFTAGSIVATSAGAAAAELGPLSEVVIGSSDFEVSVSLTDGIDCGATNVTVQSGNVIQVEYKDTADDAGGTSTAYDSSTFDLRSGTLTVDKDVYVMGSDMVVTITDPDLNTDSSSSQSYAMSILEWDSSADSSELLNQTSFSSNPSSIEETGSDTGVFQTVVTLPTATVGSGTPEYGESVVLTYVDVGLSGEDDVAGDSLDVEAYFSISNFGALIELDKAVYNWTDTVYITITSPDHNNNSSTEETIGTSALPVQATSRNGQMCTTSGSKYFVAAETGVDTGVFTAEIALLGYQLTQAHNTPPDTVGACSQTDSTAGQLLTLGQTDGVSVSYEYTNNVVVVASASILFNIAEASWDTSAASAGGSAVLTVTDADENTNNAVVNTFTVAVYSDSDNGGFKLTMVETDEDTGVFEGTAYFTSSGATSGSNLRVSEGDTVTAEYDDKTLPEPYTDSDTLTMASTLTIGTAYPPLERAPAANARVVDAFGSSVAEVTVDQQVQIAADVSNGQSTDQAFAYLVQVQDENGVTVSLAWITGSLTAGQSMSPALSWTPSASGSYTATVFVWESVDNPTALSPTTSVTIDVV